jgi:hypothetical protein
VNTDSRVVRCFEARTGELVYQAHGFRSEALDVTLTDDGKLVVLNGQSLSLRDPAQGSAAAPIWEIGLRDSNAVLLGAGGSYLAVAESIAEPAVRIIDITDPKRGMYARIPPTAGRVYPGMADIRGDTMVLTCTLDRPWLRWGIRSGWVQGRGPALAGVNLKTGDLLWGPLHLPARQSDGETDKTGAAPGPRPTGFLGLFVGERTDPGMAWPLRRLFHPDVSADRIAVLAKGLLEENPSWYMLDLATGKVLDRGDAPADRMNDDRYMMLGNPAIVDGNLLIEVPAGIMLMRDRGAAGQ